mgnify:CR=1 FL=1
MNNYQNPFMNSFPFMNPYQQYQQQQNVQPPSQVVKVNGENGAKAFQIGANSSALLLDESGLMVWLITTDGAGYKTVSAYDITPHHEQPKPDYSTLESRIQRLEMIVNGTPRNPSTDSKEQPTVTERKANDGNGKRIAKSTGNAEPTDV